MLVELDILRHEHRCNTGLSIWHDELTPGSNKIGGLIELMQYVLPRSSISTAVEVGSFRGVSAECIAQFVGKLICVDNWPESLARAKREFDARFSTEPKVSYLRMPSIEAARLFAANTLDFVYIDASHDYASVKEDILSWLPKIRNGGWLAGHDYHESVDGGGVIKAVDELLGKPEKVFSDTSWVHRVV